LRAVTFGPFPEHADVSPVREFPRIAAAGFNAVRLYEMADTSLLDEAARHGLAVFSGLAWRQQADFLAEPGIVTAAKVRLVEALRITARHPAHAGVFVGNEIPADLVRWLGPVRVLAVLEDLIDTGRSVAPQLLFAYASFPTTEYLEPANADFTAFNVYLEEPEPFRVYVKKLHHIAGDRPLVISEFGMDSQRNGAEAQAGTLAWAARIAGESGCAGFTVFSWSDRWQNGQAEVLDWDFGITDRNGLEKPALAVVCEEFAGNDALTEDDLISIIVCTRNGRNRIAACLRSLLAMHDSSFEIIVVDDGSQDGTADFVETGFPDARLLRLARSGLSAARNAGAAAAEGSILAFTDDDCEVDRDWLRHLRIGFQETGAAAIGGPNIPPLPKDARSAAIRAASGGPSHVMIDDTRAEHLPGCNLAVERDAFARIGGFDPDFHTAGDDVDFCWRLQDGGLVLGFAPSAFVWHHRRPSVRAFFRQQLGYGTAERMLLKKHPARFSRDGGVRWRGFVYAGGPLRFQPGDAVLHGELGNAGYQSLIPSTMPQRPLDPRWGWQAMLLHRFIDFLAPRLRSWNRIKTVFGYSKTRKSAESVEFHETSIPGKTREKVLLELRCDGWHPAPPHSGWDLQRGHERLLTATVLDPSGNPICLVRKSGKHDSTEIPPPYH
jgi:GT2 family glycosyltransferase